MEKYINIGTTNKKYARQFEHTTRNSSVIQHHHTGGVPYPGPCILRHKNKKIILSEPYRCLNCRSIRNSGPSAPAG